MNIADENLYLLKNGPLTTNTFDDHLNHIKNHTDYLHNFFMGREAEQRFLDHIMQHEYAFANTSVANPAPIVLKFSIGDRVKYRTSNEYGVITNMYKSPQTTFFTVKWDSDGLTQDFDHHSIDNYLQLMSLKQVTIDGIIPGENLVLRNPWSRDYLGKEPAKPISCCSDHKNQAIYTNFYDKLVKYCIKCGNEIK